MTSSPSQAEVLRRLSKRPASRCLRSGSSADPSRFITSSRRRTRELTRSQRLHRAPGASPTHRVSPPRAGEEPRADEKPEAPAASPTARGTSSILPWRVCVPVAVASGVAAAPSTSTRCSVSCSRVEAQHRSRSGGGTAGDSPRHVLAPVSRDRSRAWRARAARRVACEVGGARRSPGRKPKPQGQLSANEPDAGVEVLRSVPLKRRGVLDALAARSNA